MMWNMACTCQSDVSFAAVLARFVDERFHIVVAALVGHYQSVGTTAESRPLWNGSNCSFCIFRETFTDDFNIKAGCV